MKALSIKEPWASLIMSGKKTIETRTWKTNHRGYVLICVSKQPKTEISGMAIGIMNISNCRDMYPDDVDAACCDLYPKAKAWVINNVIPIIPFPVKGKLSLFEVDDSLIEPINLNEQLSEER